MKEYKFLYLPYFIILPYFFYRASLSYSQFSRHPGNEYMWNHFIFFTLIILITLGLLICHMREEKEEIIMTCVGLTCFLMMFSIFAVDRTIAEDDYVYADLYDQMEEISVDEIPDLIAGTSNTVLLILDQARQSSHAMRPFMGRLSKEHQVPVRYVFLDFSDGEEQAEGIVDDPIRLPEVQIVGNNEVVVVGDLTEESIVNAFEEYVL